jgi:hypothetical protein
MERRKQAVQAVHDGSAAEIERAYTNLNALDEHALAALADSQLAGTLRKNDPDTSAIVGLLAVGRAEDSGAIRFGGHLPRCPVAGVSQRPEVEETFQRLAGKAAESLVPTLEGSNRDAISWALGWLSNLGPAAAARFPRSRPCWAKKRRG